LGAAEKESQRQKHTLCKYNITAVNHLLTYNKIEECPSKEFPSRSWISLAKDLPSLQAHNGSSGATQTRTSNHPSA
jgi:hypothetical protein